MRRNPHRALLGLAALGAAIGVTVATVGAAPASADSVLPIDPVPASLAPPPAEAKIPSYVGALQPNGWYCGPAATRIALSARGIVPSFDTIASELGTTRNGTASIFEVTRVLNDDYGLTEYKSVEIPGQRANLKEAMKLRGDVVRTINEGDVVVANIIGTVYDTAGERHSYPGGHYVTITGYSDSGETVTVTDPADRIGSNEYQVPTRVMADWIASRGYTADS